MRYSAGLSCYSVTLVRRQMTLKTDATDVVKIGHVMSCPFGPFEPFVLDSLTLKM